MKTLVIYDSKFGNTKKIAETVAETLSGEIVSVNDFNPAMLTEMDVLIVGGPINGWRPSKAISSLLAQAKGDVFKDKYVAAFDTGYRSRFSGNAAAMILKALKKAGGIPLVPTHKFIVEQTEGPLGPDEIAKAKQWAQELTTQFRQKAQPADMTV